MATTQQLVNSIVEGIQEKKGFDIVTADLSRIVTAPCKHFVICTGSSPQMVQAIANSVWDFAFRKADGEKPAKVVGEQNAEWVAMDYGTVMVHIFREEAREHYDLENLWEDAELCDIPNLH